MNDQKQCGKCGKPVSATQSCDCGTNTSAANTGYEFSSPVVYDGGTGEYEFGVMQNKKTGEHARDLVLDDDDDDERGPTLVMDKPHIKKTIAPESATLPESGLQQARTPTSAIKGSPKPSTSSVHPGLFIVFVVLFITFVGVVFFFMATTKQHFKSHKQDPAVVQPQK